MVHVNLIVRFTGIIELGMNPARGVAKGGSPSVAGCSYRIRQYYTGPS